MTDEQRKILEQMTRSQTIDVRVARRAQIVLLASEGHGNRDIAARLDIGRIQAGRWRNRFAEGGMPAIESDLPRSGRKPQIDAAEIVRLTTQTTPEGTTHWSTRKLAKLMGISDTTVQKVWKANELKPHLVETFKVSRNSKFVEKLEDIVGLYLSPPEHALVLCCNGWRSTPRFHIYFTPTSASWLNMVERFFRSISTNRLERWVFRSVPELITAIEKYITVHNKNSKPFVWTTKAMTFFKKLSVPTTA